ncbi:hypothetical protein NQ317_018260 [Molorchus minor]|uniref:Uncharacterized protein n=1 Tax=Molorchus minor TaxID=1323400 RepID=A0ABQ9K3P9_9CUCU|nr:hypothetical protein NQ317_018260 [Molorchus minor]
MKPVQFLLLPFILSPGLFEYVADTDITEDINITKYDRFLFPGIHTPENNIGDNKEDFDFIVIGSGPSGSVIANRLSEVPEWKVLLLEAGGEASDIVDIPFLAGTLEFTDYNWGYKAEQQDGFCRGERRDCNGRTEKPSEGPPWAAMGNPGWSYEEVLPYFLKSEDAHLEKEDPGFHHQGGYLSVSDVPVRTPAVHAFVQSAQEAGYRHLDYNGQEQLGVSYVQSTTKNGRRHSAEKAFLRPIRGRKNLKILTNARAARILIRPGSDEAYGVKYARNKRYHTAVATKEVIVCAGGLNSPQLLMLSGIGPKEHLEELGIPVIKDLPVGQKMYDHATFPGIIFQLNESIVFDQEKSVMDVNEYVQFFKYGRGTFASIGGVEALAYIKTEVSDDMDAMYPDMELIFIGGGLSTDKGLAYRRIFNVPQETYDKIWKPLEDKYVYQILPMLVHPKSYGYIRLKSKNPFHWPKFYANFFSDPDNLDVSAFISAIREIQRINSKPSLQRYGAALVETPIPGKDTPILVAYIPPPTIIFEMRSKGGKVRQVTTLIHGCEEMPFDSDPYWECALRTLTATLYHQVATCKMGPEDDKEAVVNANLQVRGIKNLRVADTSVIPLPVTAHTAAPAYMVGEKAADLIRKTWSVNTSNVVGNLGNADEATV